MRRRFEFVDGTKFDIIFDRFFSVNRRQIYRYVGLKLDASPLWGSGSNQRWFDSLSVRWFLVDGSVPSQRSILF